MDISRPHHTRPPFKAFVHAVVLLAMPLSSFTAVCAKLSVRMSSLRRADLHSSVDLPGHQHPHPPGTWDVQHPYSTGLLSHLHPMSAQQPHVPLLLSVDSTRYSQRRPARTLHSTPLLCTRLPQLAPQLQTRSGVRRTAPFLLLVGSDTKCSEQNTSWGQSNVFKQRLQTISINSDYQTMNSQFAN